MAYGKQGSVIYTIILHCSEEKYLTFTFTGSNTLSI